MRELVAAEEAKGKSSIEIKKENDSQYSRKLDQMLKQRFRQHQGKNYKASFSTAVLFCVS
jgi:hypothetical protein